MRSWSVGERATIIGAGSGGCAAAADLTLQGFDITLYNRSPGRLATLKDQGGVHLKDPEDRGIIPVRKLTVDIGEALADSNRILIMLPTHTLGYYAQAMAPHLASSHQILLAPGHTGGALYLRQQLKQAGCEAEPVMGEAHTLPYISRMTGPGVVTVWARTDPLLCSALPATDTPEWLAAFRDAFPSLTPVESVLATSLNNLNAVMHPGAIILNAGWIERTHGGFRFYSEGTTPAVGRVLQATDDERLAIAGAMGLQLESFIDAFYHGGLTTTDAWQSGDIYRAIAESEPDREIRAPTSLDDRYMHEDIGFGLVPMMALASIGRVPTPTMAALVHLGSLANDISYAETGLNASKLGIIDMDIEALRSYVMSDKG